jgi:hypothetical protein
MEDTGPVRKHADVAVIYSDGSRGHVAVDRYQSGHVDFNVISGDEGPLATFRLAPGQAAELSAALVSGPDNEINDLRAASAATVLQVDDLAGG